ncbi:MAG: Rrf2 family transcriptional regulator [Treponema sp.]|jgi:Rrf2 family protein|nr:Rrf2 family transcriptional regulator [Treponema sp.]
MFITKEADYAVRIIRELARGSRETVQCICQQEQIPHQYGYKILKKLEKGGLVQGFRGSNGGYALTKSTGEITLYDVLTAVDDSLLINECLQHGFTCPLNSGKRRCGIHREFSRIQALILEGLKEKNLTDIF